MDKKTQSPLYNTILLKLSGEALQGDRNYGIDATRLNNVSTEIANVVRHGVNIGVVIGGGNIIRGADLCATGLNRVTADQMGMLGTAINGLALVDALERKNIAVSIMSAIPILGLMDTFNRRKAKKQLKKGKVIIFVGGTGNPLVTTDSAAALRGIEIDADIVIKATKVDGVFAADPIKNPKAERYEELSYDDVLEQRLGVMDLNAILLCREHELPLRVFNMNKVGALEKIVLGENVGTLIRSGD